jgi:SNF2 family DNA or RNA helicase
MREKTIRNALIIAPVSVLRSWQNEANHVLRRCERRVVITVVSSDQQQRRRKKILRNALNARPNQPELIITTYGMVRSSSDDFCHEISCWDYVVLDEAHNIKNSSAQVSKSCHEICHDSRTRRLILTGK